MGFLSALRNRPRVSRSLTPLLASVAPLLPSVAATSLAVPAYRARSPVASPWLDQTLQLPGPFVLENGIELPQPKIAYRLVGPAGAPVICVLSGISASRLAGSRSKRRKHATSIALGLVTPDRTFDRYPCESPRIRSRRFCGIVCRASAWIRRAASPLLWCRRR